MTSDLALVNCSVIDATAETARSNSGVWVRSGRIEAVGPADDILQEANTGGSEIIDLNGAHLMAGLINMHVHLGLKLPGKQSQDLAQESDAALALRMASNARAALIAGVTTVRLVAEKDHVDFAVRAAIDRGETVGPRIFTAGMAIACTGGHGRGSGAVEVDGVPETRRAVRSQIKAGADLIKVMASGGISGEFEGASGLQLEPDELAAAIDVAHAWGKKVTAHAGPAEVIELAVQSGLDCVEHGYRLTNDVASQMAERGTWYVPTLSVTRCKDFFERIEAPSWMMERALSQGGTHMESFRNALGHDVTVALGTDMLPAEPYDDTVATVREMEHMVEGGMSPRQVVLAATSGPAEWLGMSSELGTIEPGKHADLIAMPDDPTRQIKALRGIGFVMKGGYVYRNELAGAA